MKRIRDFARRLPMGWKMTAMILVILGSLLLSVSIAEYVRRGRSTPGPEQQNNGDPIWDTVQWQEEEE